MKELLREGERGKKFWTACSSRRSRVKNRKVGGSTRCCTWLRRPYITSFMQDLKKTCTPSLLLLSQSLGHIWILMQNMNSDPNTIPVKNNLLMQNDKYQLLDHFVHLNQNKL